MIYGCSNKLWHYLVSFFNLVRPNAASCVFLVGRLTGRFNFAPPYEHQVGSNAVTPFAVSMFLLRIMRDYGQN